MLPGRFLIILCLLCLFISQLPAAPGDSLQLRLYHGLDEIGAGSVFFLDSFQGKYWTKWNGDSEALFRRPSGSQGDFRTEAQLRGEIGRIIGARWSLESALQSNLYKFQQLKGPAALIGYQFPPPVSWRILSSAGQPSGPPQTINQSFFGMGGSYLPDSTMKFTALAGPRWDHREGYEDQGYSASLIGTMDNFVYNGFTNNLDLFAEHEDLGARLNREIKLQYYFNKDISTSSSDRMSFFYRRKRHDYHVWGSGVIGTRLDSDQSFSNQLRYKMNPSIGFLWDAQLVGSKHEDRSATALALRKEINLATALTLSHNSHRMSNWVRTRVDWGNQEDPTGLKREHGISLENGSTWRPTLRDSLDFSLAVRKRQYDTSDTANCDDRDRLRYEFDLSHSHCFNPFFRISGRAQVTLEHLVYIFSEKSDQNNWNRIFKLMPEVYFEPGGGWHNLTHFELVANTTDYDFELDPAAIKSTIYRRYSAGDSLSCTVQRGWDISLEYTLDMEDGGRLLWDEWVQQISEEYRSHRGILTLSRQAQKGARVDIGFSLYERRGWQYSLEPNLGTVKAPFLYLFRWGPQWQLTYPSANRLTVQAGGDLSWVHEWGREDYSIVNLDMRVTWQ